MRYVPRPFALSGKREAGPATPAVSAIAQCPSPANMRCEKGRQSNDQHRRQISHTV